MGHLSFSKIYGRFICQQKSPGDITPVQNITESHHNQHAAVSRLQVVEQKKMKYICYCDKIYNLLTVYLIQYHHDAQ